MSVDTLPLSGECRQSYVIVTFADNTRLCPNGKLAYFIGKQVGTLHSSTDGTRHSATETVWTVNTIKNVCDKCDVAIRFFLPVLPLINGVITEHQDSQTYRCLVTINQTTN